MRSEGKLGYIWVMLYHHGNPFKMRSIMRSVIIPPWDARNVSLNLTTKVNFYLNYQQRFKDIRLACTGDYTIHMHTLVTLVIE